MQSISFARWASPVLVLWAAVCLVFVVTHEPHGSALAALPWLFPIYAVLYVARVNALLLDRPMVEKIASGALLLLPAIPAIYVLEPAIFYFVGGLTTISSIVIVRLFSMVGVFLSAAVFGGLAGGAVTSAFERIVTGTTASNCPAVT